MDVPPRQPWPLEIRRNADGSLDEIVCDGAFVHLEQMDSDHWWMAIEKDGRTIHVNFHARGKIRARCEDA
jgi:hypothetical protein